MEAAMRASVRGSIIALFVLELEEEGVMKVMSAAQGHTQGAQ